MNCKLCGIEFEPSLKQKKAWWAKTWCETDSGLLCPFCYKAAEEFDCVSHKQVTLGVLPFASDIMNLSKSPNINKKKINEKYNSETWKHWMQNEDDE